MNNGAQGQPAPGGQPLGAQPQRQQVVMYKPEQMRKLPDNFTQQEKEKWESGLKNLYAQMEKFPPEAQQHQDAKRKLFEFSKTLTQKLQNFARQAQAGQLAAQQAGAARPGSQGQPQPQGDQSGSLQNPSQQPNRPQVPQKILDHVNSFPYHIPPGTQPAEAQKYISEFKARYMKGLLAMDNATNAINRYEVMYSKRNEEGRPLNAEEEKDFREKKDAATKAHADAKTFVEKFRTQQAQFRQGILPPAAASQQGVAGNGNGTPIRGPMSATQTQNPALQNTQTVNEAIERARNQQMGGGRPQIPNGQGSQSGPTAIMNIGQTHGGPVQNVKQEAGVPQINTQMQGRPMQNNSPQSAIPQSSQSAHPQSAHPQSAHPQSAIHQSAVSNTQVPRALTHPQALQTAARTYSSGQTSGTPNVMGHSHTHPSAPRETQNSNLDTTTRRNAPARPTMSGGPNNSGNGVLSQPVLTRAPGYSMDIEGDRVLNKKKLDELVRQVTGGGDGLGGGEGLTPEVEESILNVADTFVDQVLQAACKNAKERGSKILEIRDIQLALERGYNIRIPGYASDEIRTVRKIQPSAAWISKMSAVQASKVTGGKNMD